MSFWWKCRHCHGTGRVFEPWYAQESNACSTCDGTGNAVVDGEAERHRRRVHEETIKQFGERLGAVR
jgi:DnaJ-class molecular chaperone